MKRTKRNRYSAEFKAKVAMAVLREEGAFLLAVLYCRGRPEDDSAGDDPDIEDHTDVRPALGCCAMRGVGGVPKMWADRSEKRDWRLSIVLNG